MPTTDDLRADVSVQPLTIHRYGDPGAAPVVLVHGLTEAGTAWPDLVSHWGGRWDLHAPDLRGHGLSPRLTEDELADASAVLLGDVVAIVDALTEPVALVGHSLGGLLALRTALARPEKVWALVLEDPARPEGGGPDQQFVAANEAFLDSMSDVDRHPERVELMLAETTWSRREIEAWAACKPAVDREYVRRGLSLGDAAWEELFNDLTVPTLLVVPPASEMAPRPELLHNPRVRTVVIPDSGHCVRRDQPGRFHEAVDAFLAAAADRARHDTPLSHGGPDAGAQPGPAGWARS